MNSRFILPLLSILLTAYFAATSIRAYPTGPDPAVTGGFGEPTCNQSGCHNTFELNAGRALGLGDLSIAGLPKQYEPGKTYPIKLAITHTQDRGAWGFQLAARVKATGAQAGELRTVDDDRVQILVEKDIQYIEHVEKGTQFNVFEFNWVAPSSPVGEVIMHAAGNAANGDISADGDYIYSTSVTVSPAANSASLFVGHRQMHARR